MVNPVEKKCTPNPGLTYATKLKINLKDSGFRL